MTRDPQLEGLLRRMVTRPVSRRWHAWYYFASLIVAAILLGFAMANAGMW
jgi:hypothetical protein